MGYITKIKKILIYLNSEIEYFYFKINEISVQQEKHNLKNVFTSLVSCGKIEMKRIAIHYPLEIKIKFTMTDASMYQEL